MITARLSSLFTRWPTPIFHGDTAVLDRWLWLRARLPRRQDQPKLLDIGCGSGAFTIGTALRGYQSLGLSWDERNQAVARDRASRCGATTADFQVLDVRQLDQRSDLQGAFDVVMMLEVIEHVIDDEKLIRDAARCVKPGGKLLLTTPNFDLKPIDPAHEGPFPDVEDGGHVRKGYRSADLLRLCELAGLRQPRISYCTGFLSQQATSVHFHLAKIHPLLAWAVVNPMRLLPFADPLLARFHQWPAYSICVEADKPMMD